MNITRPGSTQSSWRYLKEIRIAHPQKWKSWVRKKLLLIPAADQELG